MTNNSSGNYDTAMNEARNVISQKTEDDLKKLMQNDEEMNRLIHNLSEVEHWLSRIIRCYCSII